MTFRRPQFVVVTTFITNFWVGMLVVVVPMVAKERMGVSATMLGLYGSIPAVFYIAAAMAGGRLSDRYGRRSIMLASIALAGLSVAAIGGALEENRRYFLFAALSLQGFALGAFWPAMEAAMGDGQRPSQLRRATGIFNVTWMTGAMAGAVVGGVLYSVRTRYEVGFSLSISVSLALIAAVFVMLAVPRLLEIAPWGRDAHHPGENHASPAKRALFVQLSFIANMVSFFMLGAYRSLMPEYTNSVGIVGWRYGLLQASLTAGMVAFNLILMHWHAWHYRLRYLLGAELAAVALLLGFALCDNYAGLLVLAFLLGGPVLVTYFSSIYYGLEQLDAKGDHCGDHEAILAFGVLFGPIMGGLAVAWGGRLLQHPAPRAFIVLSAGVYSLAIVWQAALAWRTLHRRAPTT